MRNPNSVLLRPPAPAPVPAPASAAADWATGPAHDSASPMGVIVDRGNLDIHFQPIVSLKKKSILGMEALARPTDVATGKPVSPLDLFAWAAKAGRMVELDRLCRRKALAAFSPMLDTPQAPLLFLNFESSLLDQGVLGSGALARAVQEAGLSPRDVVIEINESKVVDLGALQQFVEAHRRQGFLFALDDLGAGFSNLSRIFLLKPEILKVDRSLITGVESDFHKQEVFRSLVGLGRRVGALILAEGVETEAEVSTCVDLGADMVQGYYFARPTAVERLSMESLEGHVSSAAQTQRERAVARLLGKRSEGEKRAALLANLISELSSRNFSAFDEALSTLAARSPEIECIYVLDTLGIQVTRSTHSPDFLKTTSRLFQPTNCGADHSSKEYFFSLMDGGLPRFTTDAYISLASGKTCRTLSCRFMDRKGTPFILCLDLNAA